MIGITPDPLSRINRLGPQSSTAGTSKLAFSLLIYVYMPQAPLAKTIVSNTTGVPLSAPRISANPAVLSTVEHLSREAEQRWKSKLILEPALSRALVSYQANKGRAVYRWFKYKEAFSAGLIEYLLRKYRVSKGVLQIGRAHV